MKIKDIPKIDRPRERLLQKGTDALSKSDLLAILLGSGIKGKNVQQLSSQIIKKFNNNFLHITIDDLKSIDGIGEAKALQIVSAISLVKRFYDDNKVDETVVGSFKDVVSLTYSIRNKNKEHLVCLYLNARNVLLKQETISIGLIDRTLLHPREIFQPAVELNAASIILVHNHPSGESSPSEKDKQVLKKIVKAGDVMGVPVIDFVIVSSKDSYSFYKQLRRGTDSLDYVADGGQGSLFELLETERPSYEIKAETIKETYFRAPVIQRNYCQLYNRRYIGSKYKLIQWIFSIIDKECEGRSFADIFAGTGVVSFFASRHFEEIILNDLLYSNEIIYHAFFDNSDWDLEKLKNIVSSYNNISGDDLRDNYFSLNFGDKYFSNSSAKIIGVIRENIEQNKENLTNREYNILLASLLYSVDKIANTVGHYDAYFKKERINDNFFMKLIEPVKTSKVSIFREDANNLVKKIKTDITYIDPPYNSRQYSRFYHVLETLTKWDKPSLYGVALKPKPENMSDYCRQIAKHRFDGLIRNIDCKYLVVSYNNTYRPKSSSSQNKIALQEINDILNRKGSTKVFEKKHQFFNAGNTDFNNHKEFLFVTKVSP